MQWTRVAGCLVACALGCGDDGRPAPADMAGDGTVEVDMPPRTDSGIDANMEDAGPDDMGAVEMGGFEMGAVDLGVDMGSADLGRDGGAVSDMGAEAGADLGEADGGTDMGDPDGGMELGVPDGGAMDAGGGTDAGGAADLGPGTCSATVPCPSSDFCDFPASDVCGDGGGTGTCRPRPFICPLVLDPHCGCDGVTHNNECEANAAGTDARARGACP